MSTSAATKRFTPAEYRALERKAPYKSEYLDGSIFAMAGASREHNPIAMDLIRTVGQQLADRPCETYPGAMCVFVPATGLYTYPDVVVACDPPRFQDQVSDTLLNPTLLIEVPSPSTVAYDPGAKFRHDRSIPSFREYVVVSQDRVFVEHYSLREGGWALDDKRWRADHLLLESVGCEVRLGEIHARIAAPEGDRTGPDPEAGIFKL